MKKADYKPSLITIALTFLRLGATTFGGMWAVTKQLEDQLVHKEKWLYPGELESLLVTATLIPAPKFMSLAGIIGYRLHGIVGCIIAVASLITPGSLLVVGVAILVPIGNINGPLLSLQHFMTIAIIGILLGNTIQQFKSSKAKGYERITGIAVFAGVILFPLLHMSPLIPMIIGLVAGMLTNKKQKEDSN